MIDIRELVIYPTSKCNLTCSHCYVHKDQYELTVDDLQWIHQHFNMKKTIIMGGEPLVYKQLETILKLFPNITISTNATLVNKKIKLLKKYKDKLTMQISVEGGIEETNTIRGKLVWEKCVDAVKLLKKNRIKCYLRCSYHVDNLQNIYDEVIPFAEKHKIGVMVLPRIDLPSLNANEQILFFKEMIKHKKCAVDQPQFFRFIEKNGRCMAGSERLSVYFDGRVTPCNFDIQYTLGHVGDSEETIMRNVGMFLENFKVPPIECSTCRFVEQCHGGCYMSKSYIGCPLQHNWNLDRVIVYEKLDGAMMQENMGLLTDYVRKLGIC